MPLLLLIEKLCFTECSQNLNRCVACEVVLTEKQKIVIGDIGAFLTFLAIEKTLWLLYFKKLHACILIFIATTPKKMYFPMKASARDLQTLPLQHNLLPNRETDESVALKESDLACYDVEKDLSAHKNECVEPSSFKALKQVHIIKYFHFAMFKSEKQKMKN